MEITLRTKDAMDFLTSLSVRAIRSFLLRLSSREISNPPLHTLKYHASLQSHTHASEKMNVQNMQEN